jgi:hypothetical protein
VKGEWIRRLLSFDVSRIDHTTIVLLLKLGKFLIERYANFLTKSRDHSQLFDSTIVKMCQDEALEVLSSLLFLRHCLKMSSSYPILGTESLMAEKGHGTSAAPVQENLRSVFQSLHAESLFFTVQYSDGGVIVKLLITSVLSIVITLNTLDILKKLLLSKMQIVRIPSLSLIL